MDWRVVFYFGSTMTAVMIPVVFFMMPESVHWLMRKRPLNVLERINTTMGRLGHAALSVLPDLRDEPKRKAFVDIFSKRMLPITLLVTAAYFLHIVTFYFILKWVPKLVVDMGFSPSSAGGVLTWASVGGAIGALTFGFLSRKIELKKLTLFMFVGSWLTTALFGQTTEDLLVLSALVAFAGYFINAGIVGMYAIVAEVFPTHVRASGTGFTVGIGRGGSVSSPIIAGFLLQGGLELPVLAIVMGTGSIMAAAALMFLKTSGGKPQSGLESGDVPVAANAASGRA
jgi:MFS family permease